MPIADADLIPLAQMRQELADHADDLGVTEDVLAKVKNRAMVRSAMDGDIPARRVNDRWYFRRSDLPAIVSALGGTAPRRVGRPPKAASRTAAPSHAAVAA